MYFFAVRSLNDGTYVGGLGGGAASGKTLREFCLPLKDEDNILIFTILIPPRDYVWVRLKKVL